MEELTITKTRPSLSSLQMPSAMWMALLLRLLLLVKPTYARTKDVQGHLRYPWVISPPPLNYPTLTPRVYQRPLSTYSSSSRPAPPVQGYPLLPDNPTYTSRPNRPPPLFRPALPTQRYNRPPNNSTTYTSTPSSPSQPIYRLPPRNPIFYPSSPRFHSPRIPSSSRYSSPSDRSSSPRYPSFVGYRSPQSYPSATGYVAPHSFSYSNISRSSYYPYYYMWQSYYPYYSPYLPTAKTPTPNPSTTTTPIPGPAIWPTGRSRKNTPSSVWPTGRPVSTRPPSLAVWPTEKASKPPHITTRTPSGQVWPTELSVISLRPTDDPMAITPRWPTSPPSAQASPPRWPTIKPRTDSFIISWPTESSQKALQTIPSWPTKKNTSTALMWPTTQHKLTTIIPTWPTRKPAGTDKTLLVWPTRRPRGTIQSPPELPSTTTKLQQISIRPKRSVTTKDIKEGTATLPRRPPISSSRSQCSMLCLGETRRSCCRTERGKCPSLSSPCQEQFASDPRQTRPSTR